MPRRLLVVLLPAAAAAIAVWTCRPGEERRVRSHLNDLVAAASVPADEPDVVRIARLGRLSRGVTPDVELAPGGRTPPVTGRETVMGIAAQLSRGGPVEFRLADLQIEVSETGDEAFVRATLLVRRPGEAPRSGERRDFEGQEVGVNLVRRDGQWLVSRAAIIDALEHP